MDDEQRIARIEQLLEDTLEATEENNERLRDIQRTMRWSFWGKLLLWLLVLGLPLLFLGQIIEALAPITGAAENPTGVFGLPSGEQVQQLIDAYQGEMP